MSNSGAEGRTSDGAGEAARQRRRREQERRKRAKKRKRKQRIVAVILGALIVILIVLSLRSCRQEYGPYPGTEKGTERESETDRVYEEDGGNTSESGSGVTEVTPTKANRRLNLALSDGYRITDEHPLFYIGYPMDNVFDVVFTLKDSEGRELYKTNYVAPGTNVAIDGTAFLGKGEYKLDCLVAVYDHDSGAAVSECTTIELKIKYE